MILDWKDFWWSANQPYPPHNPRTLVAWANAQMGVDQIPLGPMGNFAPVGKSNVFGAPLSSEQQSVRPNKMTAHTRLPLPLLGIFRRSMSLVLKKRPTIGPGCVFLGHTRCSCFTAEPDAWATKPSECSLPKPARRAASKKKKKHTGARRKKIQKRKKRYWSKYL